MYELRPQVEGFVGFPDVDRMGWMGWNAMCAWPAAAVSILAGSGPADFNMAGLQLDVNELFMSVMATKRPFVGAGKRHVENSSL
jgi:hypothetical protein